MNTLDLRLAPMAGVTNAPFRLVCREAGAGWLTSEEIDARALILGNGKTETLARYLPDERPLSMQLLGADPDILAEAARHLLDAGADGIDLNMGCPAPKIVAKGQGAALMRDPLAAAVIFRTLRKSVTSVPFTIKIRGGWDDHTLNAAEIARLHDIAEQEYETARGETVAGVSDLVALVGGRDSSIHAALAIAALPSDHERWVAATLPALRRHAAEITSAAGLTGLQIAGDRGG